MMLMRYFFFLLILTSCSLFRQKAEDVPIPQDLKQSVNSDFRLEENSERDEYQHPLETLEFFGVKPNMAVLEVNPGAGYFTEILAPFLSREGQYFMAIPRLPTHPPASMLEHEKKLQDILTRNQDIKAKFIPFEPIDKRNRTKKAFADMVLSFNSIHNWVAKNEIKQDLKFCYDVLKPGGILGIVQHRIRDGKKRVPKSGYMYEKEVIDLVTKAGFQYVGKSEINANPKDTADWPEGVWTLPPTYRLGEKDRSKYEKIGESDRMTLKFTKLSPKK